MFQFESCGTVKLCFSEIWAHFDYDIYFNFILLIKRAQGDFLLSIIQGGVLPRLLADPCNAVCS
jgi:hypothetical protein